MLILRLKFLPVAFLTSILLATVGVIHLSLQVHTPQLPYTIEPATELQKQSLLYFTHSNRIPKERSIDRSTPTQKFSQLRPETHLLSNVTVDEQRQTDTTSQTGGLPLNSTDCFRHNSLHWLQGPRLGNEAGLMTLEYVERLLSKEVFQFDESQLYSQSLCYEQSRFRNTSDTQSKEANNVQFWTTRLIYLSMIYHQHWHAFDEASARFSNPHCASKVEDKGVGIYDFECKNAKFLVTSLADIGIGANVRGGAVHALLAGLASDRVVLFVNKAPTGHKYLRRPWKLTSCPRGDYQCFFFPLSPCVLTHHDLKSAYSLTKGDNRNLFRGVPPVGHENDKVWHMTVSYNPQIIPQSAAELLHNHSQRLLSSLSVSDPRLALLQLAADNILSPDEPRLGYNYGAANVKIHHALVLFSLRPNLYHGKKIEEAMVDVSERNIATDRTVGLPIRASDKCIRESECLSFVEHLQATSALLGRYGIWTETKEAKSSAGSVNPTLVFTTESQDMVREQMAFVANISVTQSLPYAFHVVTNERDVTPNTGFVGGSTLLQNASFTADDALFSAILSLRFQLLARVTVGNCCSNFHVLLADMMAAGCGAATENNFHCLQEHEDPHFRICCGWFQNCKEEKRLAIEQLHMKKLPSN